MPLRIASYLKGLLAVAETATCVSMSRVVGSSHDRLSRILNDDKLKWQTLLLSLILRIVGKLRDGYLIIDDTVIDKSFAKVIENLAWVFCSKKNRSVLGLTVVLPYLKRQWYGYGAVAPGEYDDIQSKNASVLFRAKHPCEIFNDLCK